MQLALTAEQNQLRDSVGRFVAERYPAISRSDRARNADGVDRVAWREMAELGWLGAGLPEGEGGWGGGPVETMVILERAGYGLMPEPLVAAAVHPLRLLVTARAEAGLIAGIVRGERIVSPALLDCDPNAPAFLAKRPQGYVVSGSKRLAPVGDTADEWLVSCRMAGESAIVKVPANANGVSTTGYRTLDDRRAADVTFDMTLVGEADVIARGAAADQAVEIAEYHAIAALCAEATGIAQFLLDATLDYAKTRQQFGQPISRFQALQHRLADMFVAVEEAKSLTIMATAKLAAGGVGAEAVHAVAAAKLGVLARAMHVAREAIQLHGGVGMTEDLPMGAGFRRLKAMSLSYGDENAQLDRMAIGIQNNVYV